MGGKEQPRRGTILGCTQAQQVHEMLFTSLGNLAVDRHAAAGTPDYQGVQDLQTANLTGSALRYIHTTGQFYGLAHISKSSTCHIWAHASGPENAVYKLREATALAIGRQKAAHLDAPPWQRQKRETPSGAMTPQCPLPEKPRMQAPPSNKLGACLSSESTMLVQFTLSCCSAASSSA
jgi:hypothetical protein